jgi:hypothetical protein
MEISSKTILSYFGFSESDRFMADKANEFKRKVQGVQLKSLLIVERLFPAVGESFDHEGVCMPSCI